MIPQAIAPLSSASLWLPLFSIVIAGAVSAIPTAVVALGVLSGSEDITVLAAVPEPWKWAMMLLGFAGLGFAFRRSGAKLLLACC
jgi:hypothetical protein